ncbi:MAG: esterase family protein [Clostridia bacterium]|nr:esterase family protein [Clostridia bacterium]MBQ2939247.1 esterase family protein [Clostridia bacterium]
MSNVFEGSFRSHSLKKHTHLTVIFPARLPESGKWPTLYLLHGIGGDHRSWLNLTSIARYADEAGIAVVCPDAEHSFYSNMVYGKPYYTYIAEELPAYCRTMFPLSDDPKQTYIAGLSMGGYGALKVAIRNPENYAAVGCFSGCVDLRSVPQEQYPIPANELVGVFGDGIAGEDDVMLLTSKAARNKVALPPIYLTCGLSDELYPQTQRYRQQLDFLRVPYVYDEWPGGHEWGFWDRSIRHFLQFIGK